MLRLILGRAGTGKTGLILDELNERVRSRRSGGWLIVPEQYSHEAERELAERCGDTACLYAEVVSFTRLAYRVSVSVGGSARCSWRWRWTGSAARWRSTARPRAGRS